MTKVIWCIMSVKWEKCIKCIPAEGKNSVTSVTGRLKYTFYFFSYSSCTNIYQILKLADIQKSHVSRSLSQFYFILRYVRILRVSFSEMQGYFSRPSRRWWRQLGKSSGPVSRRSAPSTPPAVYVVRITSCGISTALHITYSTCCLLGGDTG